MALFQQAVDMSMPHQYDERTAFVKEAISMSATQSVRTYGSNQEYLFAMREDLAEWLKGLYAIEIGVENFFEMLKTGVILCQHANNITSCAQYTLKSNNLIQLKNIPKIPSVFLNYTQIKHSRTSSFFARDNIANFINWCRKELAIHESLMFETDDLVQRKNEKNFILCLLEVARRGSKFGVPAPVLIQMEEDIDEEIEMEKISKEKNVPMSPKKPVKQKVTCDFKSLDEMVQYVLGMCTCPTQFPMVRVSDGKYKVGGSENLIFMRILRQHVMVRVGGGWDTLENYLNKHDPCRCQQHKNDRKLIPRHRRNVNANNALNSTEKASVTSFGLNKGRSRQSTDRTWNGAPPSTQLSPTRKPEKRSGYFSKHESPLKGRERSYTPNPESRHSRNRVASTSPEHYKNRKSTNQKENNQSAVFNRLSRPKSTPPVSRNTANDLRDETLVIQRNRKGAHEIQRTSTKSYPSGRQSLIERGKSKHNETTTIPKSKSVSSASSNHNQRASTSNRTPRQRKSTSHDYENSRVSRSGSPRKQAPSTQPLYEEIDESREREMLLAFERECIANQYTLEMRKSRSRKLSEDNLLETSSNAEDNEVAFHMNSSLNENDSLQSSNNHHSLLRPRKDKKSSQHDRRTKIPTPVSFNNRTLLSSQNIELDEAEHKYDSSQKPFHSDGSCPNTTKNNRVQSLSSPPPASGGSFSLSELNQLLNPSGSLTIEDESYYKDFPHSNSRTLDASLLHSSAHPGVQIDDNVDFRMKNPSGVTASAPNFTSYSPAPHSSNHHSAPPSSYRYASHHANDGLRRGDYANYNPDPTSPSRVPADILKTCNISSTPRFEPEFLRSSPSQIDTYAREPQWV